MDRSYGTVPYVIRKQIGEADQDLRFEGASTILRSVCKAEE